MNRHVQTTAYTHRQIARASPDVDATVHRTSRAFTHTPRAMTEASHTAPCEFFGGATADDAAFIATHLVPGEDLLCVFKNIPEHACAFQFSRWGCCAFVPLCWPFIGSTYALCGKRAYNNARYAVTTRGIYSWRAKSMFKRVKTLKFDHAHYYRDAEYTSFKCCCCIPHADLFDIEVPDNTIGNHQALVRRSGSQEEVLQYLRVALDVDARERVRECLNIDPPETARDSSSDDASEDESGDESGSD